jgi:hypothetical protein
MTSGRPAAVVELERTTGVRDHVKSRPTTAALIRRRIGTGDYVVHDVFASTNLSNVAMQRLLVIPRSKLVGVINGLNEVDPQSVFDKMVAAS